MRAPSKFPPSVVGLRSTWHCAVCKRMQLNFQVVSVLEPELAAPRGWWVENGHANCGGHEEAGPDLDGFAEGAD